MFKNIIVRLVAQKICGISGWIVIAGFIRGDGYRLFFPTIKV